VQTSPYLLRIWRHPLPRQSMSPTVQSARLEIASMTKRQLVRKLKWWRGERRRHSNSQPPAVKHQSLKRQRKFREKMSGRCFNCLSTSHRRAQCRDPTVCWKYKRIGHISSRCASSLHSAPCISSSEKASPPAASALLFNLSTAHQRTRHARSMDRHRSFGGGSSGPRARPNLVGGVRERVVEPRGSAVNYLGNPRFHPRIAAKIMDTSEEMEHIKLLLCNRAMVITEDGPMEVRSREEVKDIIYHQFGIRKHELHVFRNYPEPFIAIFSTSHDRDVVYAAARAVEGLIELRFHAWELDRFGERVVIPYHVRLCIEGIPHHAWSKEVADKVLDDEAFIHHVEQETVEKIDQRSFNCWVFCKDPSRLPPNSIPCNGNL
jgi:hypothetical protein